MVFWAPQHATWNFSRKAFRRSSMSIDVNLNLYLGFTRSMISCPVIRRSRRIQASSLHPSTLEDIWSGRTEKALMCFPKTFCAVIRTTCLDFPCSGFRMYKISGRFSRLQLSWSVCEAVISSSSCSRLSRAVVDLGLGESKMIVCEAEWGFSAVNYELHCKHHASQL